MSCAQEIGQSEERVGPDQKIVDEMLGRDAELAERVRGAVIWRSGSQILGQLVTWACTFVVIRLLNPSDYGLFAMTQVVLVFLNLMSGYGFANALIRSESVTLREVRQVFGMLILLNLGLAITQAALAPLAAAYYRQPIVADMLRLQALLYLPTPLIAIHQALLSRRIDFRAQGQVQILTAILGALTALGCALAGFGVWTLVAAPLVLFWTQGIGLAIVSRTWVWPSFRFRGAGETIRYGGAMVVIQLFWFVQIQSDVFIAGRVLDPHDLGLYTTALFLTQILSGKFIPPLNEVAFAAYARIQDRREALAAAFLKTVRIIMLVALPFYFGLAATAEPLVVTLLGAKWSGMVPLVAMLAWAMPFLTLQILFAPATNAIGEAKIALRSGLAGAVVLPGCFLVGVQFGAEGLATAWLAGLPILAGVTAALSLPAIGASFTGLARAVAPGLAASAVMAAAVKGLDLALPAMGPAARLGLLVPFGASVYAAIMLAFARPLVAETLGFLRGRGRVAQAA
jgi:O-antigen/teichoic acid export membrane protein